MILAQRNNNNNRLRVAIGLLALITIIISIVYSSHFSTAATSQKLAEEIKMTAYERFTENFDQLGERDLVAKNISVLAARSHSGNGHPRFAGRVLLKNFSGNTNTLKNFVNEDVVPYTFRFAENTKQPAQECVHYLTPEDKKDLEKFAAAINPGEGFRGGCKFRVVVDEEVSENTWEINHRYKTLFEVGFVSGQTQEEIEHIRRFVNDGNRLLVIATTRFEKTDGFMHGRSTQMFDYEPDVGNAF